MIARIAGLPAETRAVLCVLAAFFSFSLMDAAGKALTARHDPVQVVWARYASQCAWSFLFLAPRVPTLLRTARPGMHALRSAFLFLATLGFFGALSVMPLASTAAVFQTAPLFITVLSVLFLGETVGLRRWTGIGVGLLGALIVIRPGTEVFHPAALLVLAAALCNAGYAITTRVLGASESPWTNFLYTALLGTVAASLAVPFFWTTPALPDALVMAGFGILGGVGHILLIWGLRLAPASALAPYAYLSVVHAALWGFLFFAEVPDLWTIVGALVIAGAGLYVWHRERQVRRKSA